VTSSGTVQHSYLHFIYSYIGQMIQGGTQGAIYTDMTALSISCFPKTGTWSKKWIKLISVLMNMG